MLNKYTVSIKTLSNEILCSLQDAVKEKEDVLVIHSSLYRLMINEETIKWAFIDAISKIIARGYTIAIPSFTFSFTKSKIFDINKTGSEVGILANWVQTYIDSTRTVHPIYSFVVAGKRANEICKCTNSSCFGEDSTFALLEKLNARIFMMGCTWNFCTQFHLYEEEKQVPYRKYKNFDGIYRQSNSKVEQISTKMYVRKLDANPINNYDEIVNELISEKLIHITTLFNINVESVNSRKFGKVCRSALNGNIFSFLENQAEVISNLESIKERELLPEIPIAILGSNNNNLFVKSLEREISKVLNNNCLVFSPEYGQLYSDIHKPDSRINQLKTKYAFFIDRIEDIYKSDLFESSQNQQFKNLDLYINTILKFAEGSSSNIYVNSFFVYDSFPTGIIKSNQLIKEFIDLCNQRLAKAFKKYVNIIIIDLQVINHRFSSGKISDPRLWFVGRIPYSSAYTDYLIENFLSLILSSEGKYIRAIALDLDNTLWGGILGEDGKDQLKLGGDYPGNSFKHFQQTILHLSKKYEIVLFLLSKNDKEEAINTIKSLTDMHIQESDITDLEINWDQKWVNLAKISHRIGIGLEHIAFVDDNPLERELMKRNLPDVKTIDLPKDPAMFSTELLSNIFIRASMVNNSSNRDKQRDYKAKKSYDIEKCKFNSIEDFFESLKISLFLNKLSAENISRSSQLVSKTNQFNTTSIRYTAKELQDISDSKEGKVIVIGYKDKFSEFENIGVIILKKDVENFHSLVIDLFLLSCRYLGREIETAILSWVSLWARNNSYNNIVGRIVPSKRNEPVRRIYEKFGFFELKSNLWSLDCNDKNIEMPNWIKLIEK